MTMMLDFSQRANLDEAMDGLESYDQYRRCLHDLDAVSRLVLAHRPTLRYLETVASGRPLRILDVACGDGAMLRRIARWARRRKQPVSLIGLDLNPRAIRVAREFAQPDPPIEYVTGDVFGYVPAGEVDVILSAHFTHHLGDAELVRFLRWMDETARVGWFVNDLHRHRNPYRLFRLLTLFAPWQAVVKADGLLSIRRAFTAGDWQGLLGEAGIAGAAVAETFPARVTVSRMKRDG